MCWRQFGADLEAEDWFTFILPKKFMAVVALSCNLVGWDGMGWDHTSLTVMTTRPLAVLFIFSFDHGLIIEKPCLNIKLTHY